LISAIVDHVESGSKIFSLPKSILKGFDALGSLLGRSLAASYLLGLDQVSRSTASFADPVEFNFGQKPDEAIKYFKSKKILTKKSFDKLEADAKSAAFTVSGVYKKQVLTAFKKEISSALLKGTPQKETIKKFKSILAGAGHKQLGDFHLETVFRTNMEMAYGVGRRHGLEAVADDLPYWEYHAVMDDRVRPTHAALNGLILPANSPFWNSHFPPWGFNCRCTVTATDEIPDGYDKSNPSGEEGTTVFYDDTDIPAKIEIGTSVYDLGAEGFMGVPAQGGLKEVIEERAADAASKVFLQFDDADEAHEWASEAFADWKDSLTGKELQAVEFYKGSGYYAMNKYLRGSHDSASPSTYELGKASFQNYGKALDSAIEKGVLPESVTVYRGLHAPSFHSKTHLKGAPYVERGYMSTSLASPQAEGFRSGEGQVMMEIHLKKGLHAVYPDLVDNMGEAEILLPRGARFRIRSARKEKWAGQTVLHLILEAL